MMAFQAECENDLSAAEPVIRDAEAALNSLDKGSLGELKSFGSPAAEIVQVRSQPKLLPFFSPSRVVKQHQSRVATQQHVPEYAKPQEIAHPSC